MEGNWQLQNSNYAVKVILILALLPLLLSFLLNIIFLVKLAVIFLIPVFIYFLYNNISISGLGRECHLSWSKGIWTLSRKSGCKRVIVIQGRKHKRSFTLGGVMFLSILDINECTVDLWLFPDSIDSQSNSWRKLHSCFFLSQEKSDQINGKA